MNKFSTFFYCFKNTFINASYYRDILKAPFSFSFKFFLFFFLLYAIAGTTIFYFKGAPTINKFLDTFPQNLSQLYPEELIITIKDGQASTNVKEPYSISINQLGEIFPQYAFIENPIDEYQNILVIDTKGSIENFTQYKTAALLTQKNFVIVDSNNKYQLYPLTEIKDFTLDRALVDKGVKLVTPYFRYVLPVITACVFLYFLILLPAIKLIYLLFLALVLLLVGKIMSLRISYGKNYQVGLHLIVIFTVLTGILSLAGVNIPPIPFFQTLILAVLGAIAFQSVKKGLDQEVPKPQSL
ncbi:MAG: DUF1189 family protein [Patescibacteria group bacterium]